MSTSQRTFNQVKGILGKLDQRIDSLRSARLNDRIIGGTQTIGVGMGVSIGGGIQAQPAVGIRPASVAMEQTIGNGPKSIYGRATPIRPTGA